MPVYIALLRGVNVGNNTLKMDRLRTLWGELGFEDVRTYVQSGNVVFKASGAAKAWQEKTRAKLVGETRLPVPIVFRSAAELGKVLEANPFLKEKGIDPTKLHVSYFDQKLPKDAAQKLGAIDAGGDRFHCAAREIYLYCPEGYGETKLSNTRLEKLLGVTATTRNWKTSGVLFEMATKGE